MYLLQKQLHLFHRRVQNVKYITMITLSIYASADRLHIRSKLYKESVISHRYFYRCFCDY